MLIIPTEKLRIENALWILQLCLGSFWFPSKVFCSYHARNDKAKSILDIDKVVAMPECFSPIGTSSIIQQCAHQYWPILLMNWDGYPDCPIGLTIVNYHIAFSQAVSPKKQWWCLYIFLTVRLAWPTGMCCRVVLCINHLSERHILGSGDSRLREKLLFNHTVR